MAPLAAEQVQQDTRHVSYIRVVVHTAGGAKDGYDNHWSIYLLLQWGESVRANIATDYGETAGRLEWSNLGYLLTTSAIKHWDFPVAMAIEVQHVARTIYLYNRHQYQFSGGGSGCRFWVRTIMSDFENLKWITAGTTNNLWEPLQYLYRRQKDPLPIDWVEGTFSLSYGN
ncbi:hypothetical protein EMCG_08675 [[Emmonsia] crescens]|uniref:DUF7770 domain-containing protein n=1 Tax=[Emmonsia] crescens TaxID=73230 RepID=A0A0G2I5H4_9EURO|nr:hypothetical protein EMCG_08675 [Emmonsia crescens UAMH 3008]